MTAAEADAVFAADEATRQAVLAELATDLDVIRTYTSLPLAFVSLHSARVLLRLLQDSRVLGVSENRLLSESGTSHLPLVGKASVAAWPTAGSGVSVAVIDSGVDYRLALFGSCLQPNPACAVVVALDFAPSDGVPDETPRLHGARVAGIVRAIAPAAKLLALDATNGATGSSADVLAAVDYALVNRAAFNVRAINLSLGGPGYAVQECPGGWGRDPFMIAFTHARALNVLPILGSGNSGPVKGQFQNGVGYPACVPGGIRVGAIYDSAADVAATGCTETPLPFGVACFSQSGPLLNLWAPGNNIEVVVRPSTGTSFAAPHVSGAVALLAWLKPTATAAEIESRSLRPVARRSPTRGSGSRAPRSTLPTPQEFCGPSPMTISPMPASCRGPRAPGPSRRSAPRPRRESPLLLGPIHRAPRFGSSGRRRWPVTSRSRPSAAISQRASASSLARRSTH